MYMYVVHVHMYMYMCVCSLDTSTITIFPVCDRPGVEHSTSTCTLAVLYQSQLNFGNHEEHLQINLDTQSGCQENTGSFKIHVRLFQRYMYTYIFNSTFTCC